MKARVKVLLIKFDISDKHIMTLKKCRRRLTRAELILTYRSILPNVHLNNGTNTILQAQQGAATFLMLHAMMGISDDVTSGNSLFHTTIIYYIYFTKFKCPLNANLELVFKLDCDSFTHYHQQYSNVVQSLSIFDCKVIKK